MKNRMYVSNESKPNTREEIFSHPGYYLNVSPPLHNGFCFCVLHNPGGAAIAKSTRLLTGEERQIFATAYITNAQHEK